MPYPDDGDSAGWSTRELAEIAATTVKTVRYYHQAGVLPEPRRRANGYKSYGRAHLSRLLHVLRMREIGFTVPQIDRILRSPGSDAPTTERLIVEVEESIGRLEVIRADLVASLDSTGHWERPAGFDDVADGLSESDRLVSQVLARHLSTEAMAALRSMNEVTDPVDQEFERLPADASEETITALASRMAPQIRRRQRDHPMPEEVVGGDRQAEGRAAQSVGRVLSEVYNAAQLRVVARALELDDDPSPAR